MTTLIAWKLGHFHRGSFDDALHVFVWWHPDDDSRERVAIFEIDHDEGRRKLRAAVPGLADPDECEELIDQIQDELTRLDGSEFGPIAPRKMLRLP